MNFPELDTLRISVSPLARERHLSAISHRLSAPAASPSRKRRLMVILVAAALVLPVAAVAAESAVPGDPLYSLKRVFEPLRELFDQDVAAVNRIEELETLVGRVAPTHVIDRQVEEARLAVDRTGRLDLRRRLDEALERRPIPPCCTPPTTIVDAPVPMTDVPRGGTTRPPTDRPATTAQPDRTTTSITSRPSTRP